MAMAKRREDTEEEDRLRQQQEAERLRAVEAEKERLRKLAEQRGQNERKIMEGLVEADNNPRCLEGLAQDGLAVNEWYLRYMTVEKLGRQILLDTGYTQPELQTWLAPYALQDANSYVRRAAIKHLTDLTSLAAASANDAEPVVRKTAIERLFCFLDQAQALDALNHVSLADPEPDLRHMAVLKIIDQAVLAKVAQEDVEPPIRQSATKKLTGQSVIASIMINDPTVLVRSTAAERLTDLTELAKAAAANLTPAAPQTAPAPAEPEAPEQPSAKSGSIAFEDLEKALR
ncbi:MAG: hypothetical protein LBJ11_07550 [Oscillospiraceae bacterium]|jgi:hypothetical protein|nr:hypothetical protein [Oscillospiraceae bacterium]